VSLARAAHLTLHRTPLTTLPAKIDRAHTALVVIDMQNDFIADEGAMAAEGLDLSAAQRLAGELPGLLECAREAGVLVVFVRNVYSTAANWYLSDVWLEQAGRRRAGSYTDRPVCAPGSWNADFCGDVRPRPDEPVVTKHRFDAFLNTDLETVLRAHGVRTVVLTGVVTNVCVETTARQAFLRDLYVVLPADGCAGYSRDEHEASLRTIDRYFGEVVTLRDVQEIWSATSDRRGHAG